MGRPKKVIPDNFDEVYSRWKAGEITAVKAMKILNLPSSTFYRLVIAHEKTISKGELI